LKTLLSKVGRLILVIIVVTFLTQFLTSLVPGSLDQILAPFATTQQRAEIRKDVGLDENFFVRYGKWLGDFSHGDMGRRYTGAQQSTSVGAEVKRALPISLELMAWAQFLALLVAVPLGVLCAYRAGKFVDRVVSGLSFAFLALPGFALALLLAKYLGDAKILPSQGYQPWGAGVWQHLRTLIIPAVSLAMGQLAVYARLLRTDLISTLQQDFVAMAKAKGLKPGRILWRHALRPSSLTLLTVVGLQTGALIGTAVVVELIFNIPGMGSLIAYAIGQRQYVELQSEVAVVAILFVLVNFVVDYIYTLLDPRIRSG